MNKRLITYIKNIQENNNSKKAFLIGLIGSVIFRSLSYLEVILGYYHIRFIKVIPGQGFIILLITITSFILLVLLITLFFYFLYRAFKSKNWKVFFWYLFSFILNIVYDYLNNLFSLIMN